MSKISGPIKAYFVPAELEISEYELHQIKTEGINLLMKNNA
jgi:hypothetical protein